MVNIPKKQLVHLQNIGNVPGTPASKLRVGDRVMWNFGYVSTVERITPSKTGSTITVEFLGSKHPRRFSLTTLVPLATPSRQNDYWWNYDTNVYEQYIADRHMIYEPLSEIDLSTVYPTYDIIVEVAEIRNLLALGIYHKDIAVQFGVSRTLVTYINTGKKRRYAK